ncbi:MAG TPA: hypothetical protein VKA63_03235 [Candidatus Krumholzibacteria bacterium]|nr:hypothetical protein [Candidatus Krumholzibacteria bacterium]
MKTGDREKQSLSTPWDLILGTRSQIRALRVLERDREPMTVRELSRRADEHLRSTQTAVSRLLETGLFQRVGTGSQQLVRWNASHPLAASLSEIFRAERERYERVVNAIVALVHERAESAQFVWMTEQSAGRSSSIEIGLLANSSNVDLLVDALRTAVVPLMRSEELLIEVRGWSLADLKLVGESPLPPSDRLRQLWGVLPAELRTNEFEKSQRARSHQRIDEELHDRAVRLASIITSRPELVRLAREEIADRLEEVGPQEAQTLREWQQVLDGMSVTKLAHWLVSEREQAVRLRQSMPLVFLRATERTQD